MKLTKAHCLQSHFQTVGKPVFSGMDRSLQKLNEGKRKARNASLILLEANVKRIEIVPEEWQVKLSWRLLSVRANIICTWSHFLSSDSQGSSRMCAFVHLQIQESAGFNPW